MLSDYFRFEVGQWLRSAAVGAQGEFVGQVVEVKHGDFVHLRDAQGRIWARGRSELSAPPKTSVAVTAQG